MRFGALISSQFGFYDLETCERDTPDGKCVRETLLTEETFQEFACGAYS